MHKVTSDGEVLNSHYQLIIVLSEEVTLLFYVSVSGSSDTSVYLFDVETGLIVNRLQGHSSPVLALCWAYDESLLASCALDVSNYIIITMTTIIMLFFLIF